MKRILGFVFLALVLSASMMPVAGEIPFPECWPCDIW